MNDQILDTELTNQEIKLIPASLGKRFGHNVIDTMLILIPYLGYEIMYNPSFLNSDSNSMFDPVQMIIQFLYFFIAESTLNGKSLGKFVTKTKVVGLEGYPPTTNNYLIRTLVRFVPFDALSFLFNGSTGWHDKWSDTMVIDENLSTLPS